MTILSTVYAGADRLGAALADRLDDALISLHRPIDIGTDEPYPYCRNCKAHWPCVMVRRAVERKVERR